MPGRSQKKGVQSRKNWRPPGFRTVKLVLLLGFVGFGVAAVVGFLCEKSGFQHFIYPAVILGGMAAGNPLYALRHLRPGKGN
jgi:hypothetical protein